MTSIDQSISPLYLKIPVIYFCLLLCLTVLLVLYDGLIIKGISTVLRYCYNILSANKSISVLRLLSEWYYLLDKFLYYCSPHLITYSSHNDNILVKTNIFSPILFYRFVKSMLFGMFTFSFQNILLWGMILLYFNPIILPNNLLSLPDINWDKAIPAILQFEYTKVNDFLTFVSIILSMTLILWLTSSSLKWKAMRKINEEKYEGALIHQENIEEILRKITYYSEENIDILYKTIKYLPDLFGNLITHTNDYYLEEGILKKTKYSNNTTTKIEDLVCGYHSFQKEVTQLNQILEEIHQSRLQFVFFKINKSIRFETLKLGLFSRTFLDFDLIEKENFKQTIESRIKNLSHLTDNFIKINDVRLGWVKKEDFEEEYAKYGVSLNIEDSLRYSEEKLQKELNKFKKFLYEKMIYALLNHIILKEYIEISHRNTRFNFLRIIISLFGPK